MTNLQIGDFVRIIDKDFLVSYSSYKDIVFVVETHYESGGNRLKHINQLFDSFMLEKLDSCNCFYCKNKIDDSAYCKFIKGFVHGNKNIPVIMCRDCKVKLYDEDKIFYCNDCDCYFNVGVFSDIYYNDVGNKICEYCNENYFHCSHCDRITSIDNGNGEMCDECHDEMEDSEERNRYEQNGNKIYRNSCDNIIDNPLEQKTNTCFGVEIETLTDSGINFDVDVLKYFKRDFDSSIECKSDYRGVEYISCVLPINETGFNVITDFSKFAKSNDVAVNSSCGLHIHINVKKRDINLNLIKKIIAFYSKFETQFFNMLPISRYNNHYCMIFKNIAFSELNIDTLMELKTLVEFKKKYYFNETKYQKVKYFDKRYYWVNLHSLFYRGTLEIRSHSGTIDNVKIINWVKIHNACIDYILKHDIKQIELLTDDDFYLLFSDDLVKYIKNRQNYFEKSRIKQREEEEAFKKKQLEQQQELERQEQERQERLQQQQQQQNNNNNSLSLDEFLNGGNQNV